MEDEMVGAHHGLNGHQSEQTPGDSEGQGSLACCSSWGCRVRCDLVTEQHQQSFSQSNNFPCCSSKAALLYKNLSPAPVDVMLLATFSLALPNSN